MSWLRMGRAFQIPGDGGWMRSHAQIPTVLVLRDRFRVYFATRPKPDLSLTTFVDLSLVDPRRILYLHDRPILDPGPPGAFDEHGIMPSFVCQLEDEVWLYYGGWSRRTSIPYSNWTGLAISRDGGTSFEKRFPGPIVDRTPQEIYSATAPFILREKGIWHMWYASGVDWIEVNNKLQEVYLIKHATSNDGIHWNRENRRLLPPQRDHEPTHRPTVVRIGDTYHMWFCHRGIHDFRNGRDSYRIGYATSTDLVRWERDDSRAGIDVSTDGWDSRMIAYPYVVRMGMGDRLIMFYNGNGFGTSGFGFAMSNAEDWI